jgi:hypothetical protein
MTIKQFEEQFPHEDACAAYLVRHRWPAGVRCPRCGSDRVYDLKTRMWHWECPDCRKGGAYRFSHIAGTIFENTNKPLKDWFRVLHMMLTSKKGVSALQVYRVLGFGSYKTAWYMCHRLRAGLANEEFRKLVGIVEIDETYIGGKGKNRHGPHDHSGDKRKAIVIGAVERKGSVVARMIERVNVKSALHFVSETVSHKVSLVATDDFKGYQALPKMFPHKSVNHSVHQYVVGAIHTNTIEGFLSLIKRGVVGTYHKVSQKYLPLYVAEFQFRYNNRLNDNIFGEAIKGC